MEARQLIPPPLGDDRMVKINPKSVKGLSKNPKFRGIVTRGDDTYVIFSEPPTDNELRGIK